ncbi:MULTISPECIES: lipid-A-disaccharide synthase [unclassified Candidatus Frackibacter]|uniref:lipid-A-disaccharide synthase n=1 Tax=unclassified Candidatus Frackibacter TaxID=2648818 RepID=UPI000880E99A|nr:MULTISPECIES: lipid-A-disaccharide synthase [unclassified Candidatus Frackibacter]SDC09498.1 lipid-A-disaccharide synthase [Candidatus Frackibacter sp. WG11]SEM37758.1 lipid-A-disaccharide synthase [Candidatus Frackibacter sp. WG12]SFL43209.1 lipid-A-disaccharide synthase [Candidatus Frackibacter sp. WG13]
MAKVLVVAGEASGDMHAAHVIEEMKKLDSNLEFIGIGGQQMAEVGVDIIFDPTELSTIGFIEAFKHLRLMYQVLDKLEQAIDREDPDVALLVDYSGFNLKVAKLTKKKGVPTVNYFAPSAWVWGKWRAKKMAKRQARIASVFPMEEEVYREAGADVNFVGHPLLDIVETELDRKEAAEEFGIDIDREIIGLLPGSREQEIKSLLPPMLAAVEKLKAKEPKRQFILPVAETISKGLIAEIMGNYSVDIKVVTGNSYEVMDLSTLIIVASGTATLEAACLGTPMVIIYKTSLLTWWLGRLLVKLPYVGLPNIIMDKEIVPELLQDEVDAERIAAVSSEILNSPEYYNQIKEDLESVVTKLGTSGATKKVAQMVLEVGGVT